MEKENLVANETTRRALLANLKKSKIFDQLRAGMRKEFFDQMQPGGAGARRTVQEMAADKMLEYRLTVSLIVEFLMRNNFTFTQSIIVPESGLGDNFFKRAEIEELLNIASKERRLDSSLLASLVGEIRARSLKRDSAEVEIQTDMGEEGLTLDEKLRKMDLKFADRLVSERMMPFKTMEERMLKYKREVDERARAQIAAEIANIREIEVAAVRLEEQNKNRIKNNEFRASLESLHQDKIKEIKMRERDALDRVKSREKALEAASFDHRQSVLKDYETLKVKEQELKQSVELELKTVKLEKERIESIQREVEYKQRDVERLRALLDSQYKEDMEQFKREYERAHDDQKRELREKRIHLEDEEHRIQRSKSTIDQVERENVRLKDELQNLRDEFSKHRKKTQSAETQLQEVRNQMNHVGEAAQRDREAIKERDNKIKTMQEELSLLKKFKEQSENLQRERLDERTETISQLRAELERQKEQREINRRLMLNQDPDQETGEQQMYQRRVNPATKKTGARGVERETRIPKDVFSLQDSLLERIVLEDESDIDAQEYNERVRKQKELEQEQNILKRQVRALMHPEPTALLSSDDLHSRVYNKHYSPNRPNDERLFSKSIVKMERQERRDRTHQEAPSQDKQTFDYGEEKKSALYPSTHSKGHQKGRQESGEMHTIGDILEQGSSIQKGRAQSPSKQEQLMNRGLSGGRGGNGEGVGDSRKDETEELISQDYDNELFAEFQ